LTSQRSIIYRCIFTIEILETTFIVILINIHNFPSIFIKSFIEILEENRERFPGGVVHSFTGPKDELDKILKLDLYVGINGCSLKTEENLQVVKQIPIDALLLETGNNPFL